jgi:hypothetical protein
LIILFPHNDQSTDRNTRDRCNALQAKTIKFDTIKENF